MSEERRKDNLRKLKKYYKSLNDLKESKNGKCPYCGADNKKFIKEEQHAPAYAKVTYKCLSCGKKFEFFG